VPIARLAAAHAQINFPRDWPQPKTARRHPRALRSAGSSFSLSRKGRKPPRKVAAGELRHRLSDRNARALRCDVFQEEMAMRSPSARRSLDHADPNWHSPHSPVPRCGLTRAWTGS